MNPCVYCGAPWPDPILDLEHKSDCPSITNLYPVRKQDVDPHGFCCTSCGEEFKIGDFYIGMPWEDASGHTDDVNVEVTCLSCAAKSILLDK